MASPETRRLRLASQDSPIAAVRQAIDHLAEEHGLSADARFELQLAVSEAVANALRHGSADAPHVDVVMGAHDGVIEVEVQDHGHFRPRVGVESESGRGLSLMVALLDEVEFRADDGGTRVRMRKRLSD
jgi:anti-sigma regulatory factor (Ser/Thr protein kinase)